MVTALRIFLIVAMLGVMFSLNGYASDESVEQAASSEHVTHGETAHAGHGSGALNWMNLSHEETPPLIPMFLNFIVVAFLVYFLLRKGLGAKIRNRKTELETALAEANALKQEAEEAMAVVRARSEAMDTELEKIRREILDAAKAQAQQIEKDAQIRADRMRVESEALVAQEISMMATQIRNEVVEEIVALAEKQIVEKLTAADQEKLAKEYVTSVMSTVQSGK
jgi:F-type H+-transporting ATPase subunit b